MQNRTIGLRLAKTCAAIGGLFCLSLAHADSPKAFPQKMYAELAAQEGNLFFSPYSISEAFGMTYAGAAGKTAEQIAEVFGFAPEADEKFSKLREKLKSYNDKGIELNVANSVWPEKTFALREDYLEKISRFYGVSINPQDFINNAENARIEINSWVAKKTKDKIKDLIGRDALTPLTRLVLVNAIYFKAIWLSPFKESLTRDADFTSDRGQKTSVKMMVQTNKKMYAESANYQAVVVPYNVSDVSMVIVVPKDNVPLSTIERQFIDGTIFRDLEAARLEDVTLFLPRFRMEWGTKSIGEELRHIGVKEAFDRAAANFSLMSDAWKKNSDDRLVIAEVFHKAFVEVKEEGTEAAAATVITMETAGAALPTNKPKVVRADRPFLFYIQAQPSGTILFVGRLSRPD